jgi:hypothetical protein
MKGFINGPKYFKALSLAMDTSLREDEERA